MPPSPAPRPRRPEAVRADFSDLPDFRDVHDNHDDYVPPPASSADEDDRVRQWRRYGLAEGMRLQASERPSAPPAPPDPTSEGDGGRRVRTALLQLMRDAAAANKRVQELEREVAIQAARLDELARHVNRLERR
jgi:hypothetical protein